MEPCCRGDTEEDGEEVPGSFNTAPDGMRSVKNIAFISTLVKPTKQTWHEVKTRESIWMEVLAPRDPKSRDAAET